MTHSENNWIKQALAEGGGSSHPDADVLTAFTERTLLPRERDAVLTHVAGCAECRRVLSIATENLPEGPRELKPFVVTRGARPALRVMIPALGAVAALAVISTAVVRHQMRVITQDPTVARKTESSLPPRAVEAPSAGSAGTSTQPLARAAHSAFANAEQKPTGASISERSVARPHWRINAHGQPERAFADGSWLPVLPSRSTKMHVLAVSGGEVWVGGEKSEVFRSLDNGTSWRLVSLPEKKGRDHTITHIRFSSAHKITVEASDGIRWTSSDGGHSWE